jgi:hypothetical protein
MDTAIDWTNWHVQQLLKTYNDQAERGQPGSFGTVFEKIAEFLASAMNVADRTKSASQIAGSLADMVGTNNSAVQTQLETDLVDLASRKAQKLLAVQHRAELGSKQPKTIKSMPALKGSDIPPRQPTDGRQEREPPGWEQPRQPPGWEQPRQPTDGRQERQPPGWEQPRQPTDGRQEREPTDGRQQQQQRQETRPYKSGRKSLSGSPEKSLTPHFSGIVCAHKSDADWLGFGETKVSVPQSSDLAL